MTENSIHNFIIWERPAYAGVIYIPAESCVLPLMKNFQRPWGTTYCFFEKGMIKVAWWKKDMLKNGLFIAKNFIKPTYFNKKIKDYRRLTEQLNDWLAGLEKTDLKSLTDAEYLLLIKKFNQAYLNWWAFAQVAEPLALGLEALLKQSKKFSEDQLSQLTAPTKKSYIARAEEELLKIAEKVLKKQNIGPALAGYQQKYFWLNNGFAGSQYLNQAHFQRQINNLIKHGLTIKIINQKFSSDRRRVAGLQKQTMKLTKQLGLNKIQKRLVWLIKYFTSFQDRRKTLALKANYYINLQIKDLARRSGLNYKHASLALPKEYPKILSRELGLRQLRQRARHFSLIFSKQGLQILAGQKSKAYEQKLLGTVTAGPVRELTGIPAMAGRATGKVRIIVDPKKSSALKRGEILVTTMTSPDFIMALKRAKGIITDEGGITSHAAIISRELKIPCIIGTKISTRVLKDGDWVEMDASRGLVRKIK